MKRILLILVIALATSAAASAQSEENSSKEPAAAITQDMKYRNLKDIYNYKDYTEDVYYDRYSPGWSGVASYFIPGLGQMICREVGRGFAWLGGSLAAYTVTGIGSAFITTGKYHGSMESATTGVIIFSAGLISMLAIDICAIIDATRVAKVKNMYEQDLRKMYSLDIDIHPSVDCLRTANGIQPTAGFTIALNF